MHLYKVKFFDNKAIAAILIEFSQLNIEVNDCLFEDGSGRWLPVWDFDKKDCMQIANTIAEGLGE